MRDRIIRQFLHFLVNNNEFALPDLGQFFGNRLNTEILIPTGRPSQMTNNDWYGVFPDHKIQGRQYSPDPEIILNQTSFYWHVKTGANQDTRPAFDLKIL